MIRHPNKTPSRSRIRRRLAWALAVGSLLLLGVAVRRKAPELGRLAGLATVERHGDLAFQGGKMDTAEACWRVVLQERPRAPSARNKLAVLCMRQKRFTEAKALLEDGIRRTPDVPSFHYNLGLLLNMQGDLHSALASLAEVERLSPEHADVHFLKGAIYEQLGQNDMARAEFIKELNTDPAALAAWARIARSSPADGPKKHTEILETNP